jgi:hypothetical protein
MIGWTSTLRTLKQEDIEFKTNLGRISRHSETLTQKTKPLLCIYSNNEEIFIREYSDPVTWNTVSCDLSDNTEGRRYFTVPSNANTDQL